jgi:tetratricopeptide (TPR) repeat protein
MLTEGDFLRLPDDTPVRILLTGYDDEILAERGAPDDLTGEFFGLTPDLLRSMGFVEGQLAGFRYSAAGLDVFRFDDAEVGDGAAFGRALAAFVNSFEDPRPEQLESALWTACADDNAALRDPMPPIGEIIQAAGLVVEGDYIAPTDFDFGNWRLQNRVDHIVKTHGLSEDEALALLVLQQAFLEMRADLASALDAEEEGTLPAMLAELRSPTKAGKERTPPDDLVVTMLRFLEEPAVAEALLLETIGAGREDASALGYFAETFESFAPRSAKPAMRWLRGTAHERLGNILEAEKAFDAAESFDPSWPLALFDLARYASDRGDVERALSLLPRAGAPSDDNLVELLEQFRVPSRNDIARNDPCWCGSGRKYKQCHQNREQMPLEDRAQWLYNKALTYLHDGPWRSNVIASAQIRAEYWNDDDAMWQAMNDPLVCDTMMFEGGAFEEFLSQRGVLLPDDERLLAEQWLLISRSLFEVESVDPGEGITVRDIRTGDRHNVRERTASHELRVGTMICTRIVPAGETMQIFGGLEIVELRYRDELLELLDSQPSPLDLVDLFSRRYAPPELRNTDGDLLTFCEATLQASDSDALATALDALYEREAGGSTRWTDQETARGVPSVRATLHLEGDSLHVETNSAQRMDAVLAELGALTPKPTILHDVRRPAEEVFDAIRRSGREVGRGALDASDPAVAEALEHVIRQYEDAWLDEPIPALSGLTPREAADDPTRRPDLMRLLDSYPAPANGRPLMDPDRLRAALGL